MNKYYIRFNPAHIKNSEALPWQIIEIVDGIETRRIYAESVDIKVNTKTEKSKSDKNWWNITCNGHLQQENNNIIILPQSV
jgi:hypothetical protein